MDSGRPEASEDSALPSVQLQVQRLQGEIAALRDSTSFTSDRLDNLEHISRSLSSDVPAILTRLEHLERSHALHSAGLQAQAVTLARLLRRLTALEQANF